MKRIIFILALVFTLFSSNEVLAQQFNGGAFAGLSTSQISGDALAGFDKAGLYLGAYANLFTTERRGWQMEIAYIEKGSRKLARPDIGDFFSYRLGLNYVETWLLFRYKWNKHLSLEVGPSFGVLVKSKEIMNEGSSASRLDNGEYFDRTDLSLNLGVYYHINPVWSVNVRFADSVIPVRPHASNATYLLNFGQYNEVLSFSLRYEISAQQ